MTTANNTIYNSSQYGIHVHGASCDSQTLRNNIVHTATTHLIYNQDATNSDFDYNMYYDPTLTNKWNFDGTTYSTLAAWVAAQTQDANSPATADPLFINAGSAHFSLQSTSPCIDAGVDVGLSLDYAGNAVPQGIGVDIGAYEYEPDLGIIAIDASGRIIFVKKHEILRSIGRLLIMMDGRVLIRIN